MRAAVLVVPAVTFAAATVALVGLTRPRTVLAARVYGGPTTEAGSVRLSCVRRAVGVEDAVALSDLEVQLGPHVMTTRCLADGTAELPFPAGEAGPVDVRVVQGKTVLLRGRAQVPVSRWLAGGRVRPARVRGGGGLKGYAEVPGGALPTERPTEVRVSLDGGAGTPTLDANGGDLGPLRLVSPTASSPSLVFMVPITPRFTQVSLTVKRDGADGGTWEGRLPVVAGQPVVGEVVKRGGEIDVTIVAPGQHTHAYVRLDTERSRRQSKLVDLRGNDREKRGATTLTDTGERPAWLVVGDAPDLSPEESMGTPLDGNPTLDGRVVEDVLWLDGMPAARGVDEQRSSTVVHLVLALVASGAVLEVLLVLDVARASRAKLDAHLASLGEDAPARAEQARSWLPLVLGLAAVGFAFALIALLFTLKV